MARITVSPSEFHYVSFDATKIAEIAATVADAVGFDPDEQITIEVDESTFFGRSQVLSERPLAVRFESGAFEDAKKPRHLSERGATESLGVVLQRAYDRRSPGFADAPADADLSLSQRVAWDAYSAGRCARHGWEVSKPRRHYHFRARHGFSDAADAAFEQIWSSDSLTWSDLTVLCEGLSQVVGR